MKRAAWWARAESRTPALMAVRTEPGKCSLHPSSWGGARCRNSPDIASVWVARTGNVRAKDGYYDNLNL